jgi:pilus assembly protein CpaB
MNKRFLSVLVFALVVSAAASFVLYQVISARLASDRAAATTRLLVAARNLEVGALIKESDLTMTDWGGPVPEGSVKTPEDALNRGVVQAIFAGEPILESRIAARGAGAGLAATIPMGKRAVAVRVDDVVGVAGFVTPGMKVDVLISGTPPQGSGGVGTITKTLLQQVEVISAGQNIQRDAEGKPISVNVVNMLVTPEQAEILSLASNQTRIQLVLRNPTDTAEVETPGTAVQYLFDNRGKAPAALPAAATVAAAAKSTPRRAAAKAKAAPPPPPPPPPTAAAPPPPKPEPIKVVVFHGSKRAEATFEQEEKASEGKQQ